MLRCDLGDEHSMSRSSARQIRTLPDCRPAGGVYYRGPARAGTGAAYADWDDPLPRAADRGGLSRRQGLLS